MSFKRIKDFKSKRSPLFLFSPSFSSITRKDKRRKVISLFTNIATIKKINK